MDDAGAAGFVERISDLNSNLQQFGCRQWSFAQALRKRFAFQVFHYEKVSAVVVQHADMGMLQL